LPVQGKGVGDLPVSLHVSLHVSLPSPVSPVAGTNYVCISRPRARGACLWGGGERVLGTLVVHTQMRYTERFNAPLTLWGQRGWERVFLTAGSTIKNRMSVGCHQQRLLLLRDGADMRAVRPNHLGDSAPRGPGDVPPKAEVSGSQAVLSERDREREKFIDNR